MIYIRKGHTRVEDPLTIKKISNNIIHLSMPTQKEISSLLIRFQEYYESPIKEIRGKIFTLGYLKHLYSLSTRTERGGFTYHRGNLFDGDWNGFNFPGEVIEPFVRGLFDPLTPGEEDVVELLKWRQDKFYVIGTHAESGEDWVMDHEVCHALYYINEAYRVNVDEALVEALDSEPKLANMYTMLKSWGYCDEVLADECHAYISADYKWLCDEKEDELDKFDIEIPEELHKQLRKIKKKYFKPRK